MPPYKPLRDRLLENVFIDPATDCWNWQGAIDPGGYGFLRNERGSHKDKVQAHRASFELHCGPVPDGMIVCHRCDNRRCVNPDHLFLGTHDENMADMARKGRARRLSEVQAREILARHREGESQAALARAYGVSRSTIFDTLKRAEAGDFGPAEASTVMPKYTKLTDAARATIVQELAVGASVSALAKHFGVDRKTIRMVRDR